MVEITYQMVLSTLQTAGLLVGIVYYITIMRNQQKTRDLTLKAQEQTLRTRESQLFMNIYNQSFANPMFLKSLKKVMNAEFNSFEDWLKAYDWFNPNPENPELLEAIDNVNGFYEGLGVFIKEDLIDIRLIALTMTGATRGVWEKQAPFIDEARETWGNPLFASEFEYLYKEIMRYNEEHPNLHG